MSPRRLRLAVLVMLAVLATVEGYRAWSVIGDVRDGRALMQAAQSRLEAKRLDATTDDLDAAQAQFSRAQAKFASARSTLDGDPLVSILRHAPLAGGQLRAASGLARIGQDGAAIGVHGTEAARAFDDVRARGGGTLPEETVQIIDGVDPHINDVETQLASVDRMRAGIGSRSLLPPLRSALGDLDRRRARLGEFLDTYRRSRDFAPAFLGFDGPRTYLVLAQNNAELLPTGGLVSVAGTLRIDRGRVVEMRFQDAVQMGEDWMDRTGAYVEPPKPLKQYLLKDTSWNLLTSNWSPDFPTSAQTAARFFQMETGAPPVDGVIALDFNAMERLLEVTGPVDIPDFDVTVTADNAFDLTEQYTRAPYEPQADRKQFAALLADAVLRRVLRPSAGQWSPLVDTVQRLGDEKDLLIYSFDPKQQTLIRQFGWDGSVSAPPSGDYLMLVDASVNSTKLNAVIDHSASIDVQLGDDGAATTTVDLRYNNPLSAWAEGRDPQLVDKLMLGGMYGGYVRLLAPAGSRIVSVRDATGEVGIEDATREQGLASFGRFFALPRDQRASLKFTYVTPPVVQRSDGGWTYTLRLQRQPGWRFSSVRLNVSAPPGMRRDAVAVDGKRATAGGGALDIDLSRDRTITVTFTRAG